jgi:phosphatidylserine/phosphatidylglycerophosphate/cardiolipin synthase-like enzyme
VDDERVLLGSQNWSTTGLLTNREASLLVDHAGIASYFAGIFDSD